MCLPPTSDPYLSMTQGRAALSCVRRVHLIGLLLGRCHVLIPPISPQVGDGPAALIQATSHEWKFKGEFLRKISHMGTNDALFSTGVLFGWDFRTMAAFGDSKDKVDKGFHRSKRLGP